jgi:glucose-1-phosphate cytidylyltransferase
MTSPKVVILAGGLGTRLAEETVMRPKPMVEIGGRPILWHLMKYCASQGMNEFVVALGYKGEQIKRYFLDYHLLSSSITARPGTGEYTVRNREPSDWIVHLEDTGLTTQTGGRLRRLRPIVSEGTFFATYGDGLSDVDLHALIQFHRAHGRLATVTAVRPPARFGGLRFEADRVAEFVEKPQTGEGWINGGFFALEPAALDYIEGDDTIWERGPLENLAKDGQLMAYRHDGFFQPMDTLREKNLLEELWQNGCAPWKNWP